MLSTAPWGPWAPWTPCTIWSMPTVAPVGGACFTKSVQVKNSQIILSQPHRLLLAADLSSPATPWRGTPYTPLHTQTGRPSTDQPQAIQRSTINDQRSIRGPGAFFYDTAILIEPWLSHSGLNNPGKITPDFSHFSQCHRGQRAAIIMVPVHRKYSGIS